MGLYYITYTEGGKRLSSPDFNQGLPAADYCNNMEGYIKDWRKELESDVWKMPLLYHRIWQWLKYTANHKDKYIPMRDGTKLLVRRGQKLTSVRQIAESVGWYERGIFKKPNPKTIQDILDWLVNNGMITIETGNRKYTLITIVNYCIYQTKEDVESNSQYTDDIQSLDINKNDKNDKNDKKVPNDKNDKNEKKVPYAEFVKMTETEYQKLVQQYGETAAKRMVEILDNYKGAKGKTYKNDYRAILNWVVKRYEEEEGGKTCGRPKDLAGKYRSFVS